MPAVGLDDPVLTDLKARIASGISALGTAVATCTTLSQARQDQFRDLKNRALQYIGGGSLFDWFLMSPVEQGQRLLAEMQPWYQILKDAGCANVPPAPPPPAAPVTPAGFMSSLGDDLKWIVIGLIAVEYFRTRRT